MVMTRSTALGSIVCGSIMLGFAIITVICGAISASKLSGEAAASAGLWSLFFALPGILTIVAGASKNGVVMGFALFFNIIAVIVSSVATLVLIIFTAAMNEVRKNYSCRQDGEYCHCYKYKYDFDNSGDVKYRAECSDMDTIHSVVVTLLVVYIIIALTSFIASIFGCMGTCCVPADPIVIVTSGVPVHAVGGQTVIVQATNSNVHGYPAAMPPPIINPAPPPAYDYEENRVRMEKTGV